MDVAFFHKKQPTSVGTKIRAFRQITQGGGQYVGDPKASLPSRDFIHAYPGDTGNVVGSDEGLPTIHWSRTGTVSSAAVADLVPFNVGVA